MLGMVFTEFIEMVEDQFGPATADAILSHAVNEHDGAFTAVGYYPHAELVALVVALSERVQIPVSDLVQHFGRHLMQRFTQVHPAMFERAPSLFDLVAQIDNHIHVEVRRLYSEASLPRFDVLERSADKLVLLYQSPRQLHDLALGLLQGAAQHYGEPCRVSAEPRAVEGQGPQWVITLERQPA